MMGVVDEFKNSAKESVKKNLETEPVHTINGIPVTKEVYDFFARKPNIADYIPRMEIKNVEYQVEDE